MMVVDEVAAALKLVSDTFKNLKEIYTAVHDGYQYFSTNYPEIKKDVAGMCVELRKTCTAVATAAAVMTHFRFNVSPGAIDNEPTRFNEYFIKYKTDAEEAQKLIRELKGSCTKIIGHAEKLKADAASLNKTFLALFGLHSPERAQDVEEALANIYNEEKEWYIVVGVLSENLTKAIQDVSNALGAGGTMHAANVPAAAQLLNEYATLFGRLELEARSQADEIQALIDELNA
jgi:hypothetical protein